MQQRYNNHPIEYISKSPILGFDLFDFFSDSKGEHVDDMRDYEVASAYHEGRHVVGHEEYVSDQAEAEASLDHLHD